MTWGNAQVVLLGAVVCRVLFADRALHRLPVMLHRPSVTCGHSLGDAVLGPYLH